MECLFTIKGLKISPIQ